MANINKRLEINQIIAMKRLKRALELITEETEKDKHFEKFIKNLQVFDTVDSMEENLGKVIDNLYEQKL